MIHTSIPKLDSSADTKTVVFLMSWIVTLVWLLSFEHMILTPAHRISIQQGFESFHSDLGEFASSVVFAFIFAATAFWLLEIHINFYDRLFVKWQTRHESDFILPRLFGPFRELFSSDYSQSLKSNSRTIVVRVFLPFISGNENRLDSGFIQRFYRALVWYWITQVIELGILTWLLFAVIYAFWGRTTGEVPVAWQAGLLFTMTGAAVAGALHNQTLVRASRKAVRRRAQEEIDEILESYSSILQRVVVKTALGHGFLRDAGNFDREMSGASDQGQKPEDGRRVAFLASPMAAYAPAEYTEDRTFMLKLIEVLRTTCGFSEVFYAGEKLTDQGRFEDEFLALFIDLKELNRCNTFIFHYPARLPSSALFEFGYAMALGKQIVMFVRSHGHLPFLLRAASQMDNVTEFTYKDPEDLLALVVSLKSTILSPR